MSLANGNTHTEASSDAQNPMTLVEASKLKLLDAAMLHFSVNGIDISLTVEKNTYDRIQVFRAFPLSEPGHFLSVRDEHGGEIGVISDPGELSKENKKLIEEHLERRYLVPKVTRILSTKERFGTIDWVMETDRGKCRFTTRNLRENSQQPSPGRMIIEDVNGNRYDIPDVNRLSRKSQDLLFRFM